MNRRLVGVGILVGVAAVGVYLSSPLAAVHSLSEAFRTHDAQRLSELIDFPKVRETMKKEMSEDVTKMFSDDPMFKGISSKHVPAVVNAFVDGTVTPKAFAGREAPEIIRKQTVFGDFHEESGRYMKYIGLNKFEITKEKGDDDLKMVMVRHGLLDWKVEQIHIPDY